MKGNFLRKFLIAFHLLFSLSAYSNDPTSIFLEMIEKETDKIRHSKDIINLADAYSSRGESYLLLGCFNEALNDFSMAYSFTSLSEDEEGSLSTLRVLIDTFFTYAFMDDLENVQTLFDKISPLIKANSCCTQKAFSSSSNLNIQQCTYRKEPEPNYPVLGPEHITIRECTDRVISIARELELLSAAIPSTQIRALAIILIEQLETEAIRCCRNGGLWKGCLQKLVNKFHYWQQIGVPSDLSYYTGVNFM